MAREEDTGPAPHRGPHPSLFGCYVALVTLGGLGVLAFMLARAGPGDDR